MEKEMRTILASCCICLLLVPLSAGAQTASTRSILGTVNLIQSAATEFEVKPDNGPPVSVKITPTTIVQRVAPGETDLKKAAAITLSEVAKGDRVLVTLAQSTT